MTNSVKPGMIKFLGNDFTLSALENAFNKSNDTFIEPGSLIHDAEFDQSLWPASFAEKYKKPIVTIHEGMYVLLVIPKNWEAELDIVEKDGKKSIKLKAGFKAKFVTKYNFNQSKYKEPPKVDVNAPIYEDRTFPKREFQNRPRFVENKNSNGGGFNPNRRFSNRSN